MTGKVIKIGRVPGNYQMLIATVLLPDGTEVYHPMSTDSLIEELNILLDNVTVHVDVGPDPIKKERKT